MIIVKSIDKRTYSVVWDDITSFYNVEGSTWDAIPAFFYASIWMEDKKQYSDDAYMLHSYDVDRAYPIW